MNPTIEYLMARDEQIKENMKDKELEVGAHHFFEHIVRTNYVKNFTWLGVPILQLPSDLMVLQEIIYSIRPDVIIETGVAFGGMLMFYATCLEAIGNGGRVIGIDIDIRDHTTLAVKRNHLGNRIELHQMNSVDFHPFTSERWRNMKVLVSLDSNHTHDHVLAELRLYSPLVSVGSYIIVFDTTIEAYGHFDPERNRRPWGPGNNPATAVQKFMEGNEEFIVDREIEARALLTAAPGGYLRRVKGAK